MSCRVGPRSAYARPAHAPSSRLAEHGAWAARLAAAVRRRLETVTARGLLRAHTSELGLLLLGVVLPLILLAELAEDVWRREGFAWDLEILRFMHDRSSPVLDVPMVALSIADGAAGLVVVVTGLAIALARVGGARTPSSSSSRSAGPQPSSSSRSSRSHARARTCGPTPTPARGRLPRRLTIAAQPRRARLTSSSASSHTLTYVLSISAYHLATCSRPSSCICRVHIIRAESHTALHLSRPALAACFNFTRINQRRSQDTTPIFSSQYI